MTKENKSIIEELKPIQTIIDGDLYLVDQRTGISTKIVKEDGALKTSDGRWRPEVVSRAWQLYMKGKSMAAISRETSVPVPTVRFWISGKDQKSKDPKCWRVQRKKIMEELLQDNREMQNLLAKELLQKMIDYIASDEVLVGSLDDAIKCAEVFKKVLNSDEMKAPVEINLTTHMTEKEALAVLIADPANKPPNDETSHKNSGDTEVSE